MFVRSLQPIIESRFHQGKTILILGPRQVGKTTLINACLANKNTLFLDGDDPHVQRVLHQAGFSELARLIGSFKWVFIDEAQRIKRIGLLAKIMHDQFPDVQLLISGSSALEISQSTQEPLTGRKFQYTLYPISWGEFEAKAGYLEAEAQLEERLIMGSYPDVLNHRTDAHEILQQLTESYLYRDVLSLTGIRRPELLDRLVKALALQLGSEVSYNELSQFLGIDKATVAKYIDLLEQAFIVFRLPSLNRNRRNEIKNSRKIYFWDNGIRNMVINNLNPLNLRSDKGALWENFLIAERLKMNAYERTPMSPYFWRTVRQQEIDYVEDRGGQLMAFEFKWEAKRPARTPKPFLEHYGTTVTTIDRSNFRSFILPR